MEAFCLVKLAMPTLHLLTRCQAIPGGAVIVSIVNIVQYIINRPSRCIVCVALLSVMNCNYI